MEAEAKVNEEGDVLEVGEVLKDEARAAWRSRLGQGEVCRVWGVVDDGNGAIDDHENDLEERADQGEDRNSPLERLIQLQDPTHN